MNVMVVHARTPLYVCVCVCVGAVRENTNNKLR